MFSYAPTGRRHMCMHMAMASAGMEEKFIARSIPHAFLEIQLAGGTSRIRAGASFADCGAA